MVKESTCPFRRWEFDPWVGKILSRRKQEQIFLLGKFHGQKSLAGYSPCSDKELDPTEYIYNELSEPG